MPNSALAEITLTPEEQDILDTLPPLKTELVQTLMEWSSQNSGSHNSEGLTAMRTLLRERAVRLNGLHCAAEP